MLFNVRNKKKEVCEICEIMNMIMSVDQFRAKMDNTSRIIIYWTGLNILME